MGGLRRRHWSVRRYGPGLTMIFLAGVWPRAGLAEGTPGPRGPAGAEAVTTVSGLEGSSTIATDVPEPVSNDTPDPVDNNAPEPVDINALGLERDRANAADHALYQILPRDRTFDRLLNRARDDLATKDLESAIEDLQKIFDTPDDVFTRDTHGEANFVGSPVASEPKPQPPRSLRSMAERLLSDSPEALLLYQRTQQPFAASLLQDALAGNPKASRELLRRFPLTREANEWNLRHASRLIDAGRFDEASDRLARVSESRGVDAGTLTRVAQMIASMRRQVRGHVQTASAARSGAGTADVARRAAPGANWNSPGGVSSGNPAFASIGPVLSEVWRFPHHACVDDPEAKARLESALLSWQAEQLDYHSEAGPAGPQSVVVSGDRVVYRDFGGLVARRLSDGDECWRLESPGSLVRTLISQDDASDRGLIDTRLTVDSVAGELTADEENVYWVERIPTGEGLPETRVVAVGLRSGERRWEHRSSRVDATGVRSSATATVQDAGPTSFILGPPTPTPYGLMLVAETFGRLELRALSPDDGTMQWAQSIALADVPATRDRLRTRISCRPVTTSGLVICNTQLGTIVAIDAVTGTLRWVREYADLTAGRGGRPRSVASREFNDRAFPNAPIESDGVLYAMPIQSSKIVAVAVQTGDLLWEAARDNDLTVAAVDEENGQIVVVGDRFVRGLRTVDGHERWRVRVPSVVGRGVVAGSKLILPVASGRLLRVDLAAAEVCDDRWERAARPDRIAAPAVAGNLAIVKDWIIRSGPTSIAVMPRSETVAARELTILEAGLRESATDSEIAAAEVTTAQITLARIALASGRPEESLARLKSIDRRNLPSNAETHEYEHLLRETLFASLSASEDRVPDRAMFDQLDQLARTTEQAARVLKHRLETAVEGDHWPAAEQVARQLASLTDGDGVGRLKRQRHDVSVRRLAGSLLASLNSDDAEQLHLSERATRLAKAENVATERSEFLTLFGRRPESGPVRLAEAARLVEAGELQAAEQSLLAAVRDGDIDSRVQARLALAGLYSRHDLPRDAARQWELLLAEAKDRSLGGGITVGDLAERISPTHPVGRALRQRQRFPRPAYAASIRTTHHDVTDWCEWYERIEPKMDAVPGMTLDVLDLGRTESDRSMSRLLFVDRTNPAQRGSVVVPSYYEHPPTRRHPRSGHLMPLGYYDPLAVSLLERRVLWSSIPRAAQSLPSASTDRPLVARSRVKFKVACVEPDTLVLQQRERLVAVEPMTGAVLWERTDLDRKSGRFFDEVSGIVGDADRLAVFESDGNGYQVFSTVTGERLARGRLEPRGVHVQRARAGGSRFVFYVARTGGNSCFRLWDSANPLAEPILTVDAGSRPVFDRTSDDKVAFLDSETNLHLVDLDSGRTELICHLPGIEHEKASNLHVFEQDGLLFVDVAEPTAQHTTQYALPSAALRIPHEEIAGWLTAIKPDGRGSGEILWSKQLGRSTIFTGSEYRLPILLAAAKVRPMHGSGEQVMLRVLRTDTGEELAVHRELPRTPFWRWDYSVDDARIDLLGPEVTVTIRIGGVADVAKSSDETRALNVQVASSGD